MPRISQNVKQNRLSALAQLCEIHIANGLTTTAELVAKTGYEARSIRAARAELECRHSNAARQSNAGNRMPNGNRMPDAGIYKERAPLKASATQIVSSSSSEAKASGADAPAMTPEKVIWGPCLDWMRQRYPKMPEDKLRQRLGKLAKDAGGKDKLLVALMATMRADPVEAFDYLTKAIKGQTSVSGPTSTRTEADRKRDLEIQMSRVMKPAPTIHERAENAMAS